MSSNLSILSVVLLSIVGVVGDSLLKKAGVGKTVDMTFFWSGFIIYSSTALGWYFIMKHLKLGLIGLVYSVSTLLLLVLVGSLFFGETLSSIEKLGVVLGIISITLLFRFN